MIRSSRLTEAKNQFGSQQQSLQQQGIPQPTPADPVVVQKNAVFEKNITAPNGVFQGDILTEFLRLGEGGVTIKGAYERSQFGNKYLQIKTLGPDYYVQVFDRPQPNQPTPIPSSTPPATQNPTPSPAATQNPTPTPAATQNPTPTPAHTPYPPGTPAATQNPTATPVPTSSLGATPTITLTETPLPTNLPTRTPTASRTPTPSITASRTPTPSVTASRTPTPTRTPTIAPSSTVRPTDIPPTRTPTPTPTINLYTLLNATYSQSTVADTNDRATFAGMTNNSAFDTRQTGTKAVANSFSWIKADLGGIKQINKIVLGYPQNQLNPGDWSGAFLSGKAIQISPDGVVWQTVVSSIPSQPLKGDRLFYTFEQTATCRYVRVITNTPDTYLALTEFQVYAPSGP